MSRPRPRMDTHGEVFGARIVAFVIDSLIIGVVTLVLAGVVAAIGFGAGSDAALGIGFAIVALVTVVLQFGYFIYFEGTSGQTPGKGVMDIVVVKEDGTDCDYAASAVRNLLRVVDQLGIVVPYLVGLVVMYVTDKHQRVGDIVADTVVVRTQ